MSMLDLDLDDALEILGPMKDVVVGRPVGLEPPGWATRRGWADFLETVDDEALHEAETHPAAWLARHGPPSLRAHGERVLALTRRYETEETTATSARPRHVKKRKQAQIEALSLIAKERFADVDRIVDLGSGHGHLTRALDDTLAPEESIGVDRNEALIVRARTLGGRFVVGDGHDATLRSGDLVVGLHPCGDLGDVLVRHACDAGAHVLMVSCCFQKVAEPERAFFMRAFDVPQPALGLANLAPISFEGSESLDAKRRARRIRLALRLALEARGYALSPGDEARGLTKERIRQGLGPAADRAFGLRDLEPASDDELAEAMVRASQLHGRIARYALPRHALARVLELAIVLDRALHLEHAGWETEARPVFPRSISPRNLGIIARAPSGKISG